MTFYYGSSVEVAVHCHKIFCQICNFVANYSVPNLVRKMIFQDVATCVVAVFQYSFTLAEVLMRCAVVVSIIRFIYLGTLDDRVVRLFSAC